MKQKQKLQYMNEWIQNVLLLRILSSKITQLLYMNEDQNINDQLNRLENTILDKIDSIKKLIHEQDKAVVEEIIMKKNTSADPSYPKYDKKTSYYQQFWKVYLLNQIMISKIKDYSVSNKQIASDVQILQDAQKEWNNLWVQKSKKKMRRTSDMIQKSYICPFDFCHKNYGSDVSLNLHMKIKHNSGTKTQRQALAKQICLGQEKGYIVDQILTFPPGYLQQFRQNFKRDFKKII